jgi:hypothetical protein
MDWRAASRSRSRARPEFEHNEAHSHALLGAAIDPNSWPSPLPTENAHSNHSSGSQSIPIPNTFSNLDHYYPQSSMHDLGGNAQNFSFFDAGPEYGYSAPAGAGYVGGSSHPGSSSLAYEKAVRATSFLGPTDQGGKGGRRSSFLDRFGQPQDRADVGQRLATGEGTGTFSSRLDQIVEGLANGSGSLLVQASPTFFHSFVYVC